MKIVFFGTPEYVLPVINALHKRFKTRDGKSPIVAVVTQKPKPKGRKKKLSFSPVDAWAHKKGLPTLYSAKELLEKGIKANIGVLASFGEIIPKEVLNYLPQGILNIHPSLLPEFRGASPVQAAIITNKKTTGVTIIKLDEKLDHGPIISQFKEEILPIDTTESLRKRLFEKAAPVLTELIEPYIKGKITLRPQDDTKASFTTQIKKDHAFIPPDFLQSAVEGKTQNKKWKIPFIKGFSSLATPSLLERFIRAMLPWPISWTYVKIGKKQKTKKTKRLKILKAQVAEGRLILEKVQLEGKRSVSWEQFKQGYPEFTFK